MRRSLLAAAALVGALVAPQPLSAQLNLISPACGNSNALTFMGAQLCRGAFEGNNKNQQAAVLAELAGFGEGPWSVIGSSDDNSTFGPFTSNPGTTSGTLTFDTFITGSFALAVKAGNAFSLYYFTNVGGTSSVLFTTVGTSINSGNSTPNALSHATLYRLTSSLTTNNVVPEPSTYALMATGLIGLAGFARRRRSN